MGSPGTPAMAIALLPSGPINRNLRLSNTEESTWEKVVNETMKKNKIKGSLVFIELWLVLSDVVVTNIAKINGIERIFNIGRP